MDFFSAEHEALHKDAEQLKRIKSASKIKMDSVDFDSRTGKIKNYDVSLDKCTCMDFGRRHKPCKHIYRLAIELGVFNADERNLENAAVKQTNCTEQNSSRLFTCVFSYYDSVPKDFVVIDFETANTCPDSVCQIGIVVVENNLITEQRKFLIRPPYEEFTFTDIHGITFADVKNEPTFGELWQQIGKYIAGRTIAAYNLSFDLNCLVSTLNYYKISCPNFVAFDVLANVRSYKYFDCELSELRNYRLVTVAEKLGLEHRAHDALGDALVTAQIQIYLSKDLHEENTLIYFPTISALTDAVARNKISSSAIGRYCGEILSNVEKLSYDEYKDFFKLAEQVAALHDDAALYKYCGMFYEECKKIPRAIALYKQALSLNEKLRLKSKIKSLERVGKVQK